MSSRKYPNRILIVFLIVAAAAALWLTARGPGKVNADYSALRQIDGKIQQNKENSSPAVASEASLHRASLPAHAVSPVEAKPSQAHPDQGTGTVLTTDPPPFGERSIATVTNGKTNQTLTPDQLGHFPRVYIQPRQTVPVKVGFPDGHPDEPVAVRVEDGGRLDDGVPGKVYKLDADNLIQFNFQANADLGAYNVVVSKGGEERVLNFWAGPETPMTKQ